MYICTTDKRHLSLQSDLASNTVFLRPVHQNLYCPTGSRQHRHFTRLQHSLIEKHCSRRPWEGAVNLCLSSLAVIPARQASSSETDAHYTIFGYVIASPRVNEALNIVFTLWMWRGKVATRPMAEATGWCSQFSCKLPSAFPLPTFAWEHEAHSSLAISRDVFPALPSPAGSFALSMNGGEGEQHAFNRCRGCFLFACAGRFIAWLTDQLAWALAA